MEKINKIDFRISFMDKWNEKNPFCFIRKAMCLFLLILGSVIQAQTLMNKDSLLKLLPVVKEDTNAVFLYINIGQQYESSKPEVAKAYYHKAGALSKKINYPLGIIKFIANYTFVLNQQGLYDSSLYYNLKSVKLSRQIKDSVYLAKTLFNTGTSYRTLGNYEKAVSYYLEGQKLFAKINQPDREALINDLLQVLYMDLHQYSKGISYGELSVKQYRLLNFPNNLAVALSNLGANYAYKKQFGKAIPLFQEALFIGRKEGDMNMEANQMLNLGDAHMNLGNYGKMKDNFERALRLNRKLKAHEGEAIALRGISIYYQFMKKFELAKQFALEALAITETYKLMPEKAKMLNNLANISFSQQDIKTGFDYSRQSKIWQDSLLNETIQKNVLHLEKRFQFKQKETQIKQLETEKKLHQLSLHHKNILNYILIGGVVALLLISFLSYRNYRQKQKIQQQRISELENERQLTTAEALLKGEESERTRLARDLHDGLGGMLTGVKFQLNSMKGNVILSEENAETFTRSISQLDNAIAEMRRVAHNMMPEALLKFGLNDTLQNYCDSVSQNSGLAISFQSFGMENRLEQTTEIVIYRIVQELMNNTLKHANAANVYIQLSRNENTISLTVEDDGKGFDVKSAQIASKLAMSGIGLSNIQHRVDYLNGKMDVKSDDKGTSTHIEFEIA